MSRPEDYGLLGHDPVFIGYKRFFFDYSEAGCRKFFRNVRKNAQNRKIISNSINSSSTITASYKVKCAHVLV
jgi:hypothetical protein